MKPDLVKLIEEKLTQEQWSPDQISGWLMKNGAGSISHERIYQHVWEDKKNGGTLYLQLRHRGKKYNKRKGKTSGRGLIPKPRGTSTSAPPLSPRKAASATGKPTRLSGRVTKASSCRTSTASPNTPMLTKLPDKSADSVVRACGRILLPLADRIETITYDNGKEFASHAEIVAALGAKSYFAKPYHSWERGLNEHTNGLVRQYFPKGTDFSTLSNAGRPKGRGQTQLPPPQDTRLPKPQARFS